MTEWVERVERGERTGGRVLGEKWDRISRMLEELDPDFAHHVKAFAYGDVYSRPGLDLKARELMAITALTQQGLEAQLKTHVYGALNVGWTPPQIREAFLHMALYMGFPRALAGLKVAETVLAEACSAPAPTSETPPSRAGDGE